MTKEEMDLLLRDICARLPYNDNIVGANNDMINQPKQHHFDCRGLIGINVSLYLNPKECIIQK